jgi:Bacterial Ig domain/Right handed beta helix region
MKRLSLLLIPLLCSMAFGTTRYVAQTAGTFSGGAACNGQTAITVATFNSTALSAGDTTYICGTITASAGASNFIVPDGAGSSGNPVTIIFDTGAVLTATYWSGAAINLNGQAYETVNGGTNGTIQATANGTGLANQQDLGVGVACNGCSNLTIENLTISDGYIHTCTLPISNCTDEGGQNTEAIYFKGGSRLSIHNNTINNYKWCIYLGYGASGGTDTDWQVYQNTVSNCDHGGLFGDLAAGSTLSGTITSSGCTNNVWGNSIKMGANWDDAADDNHHDGWHNWANNSGSSTNGVCFYNNYFFGDPGVHGGSDIFLESGNDGTVLWNNVGDNSAGLSTSNLCTGFIGPTTGGGPADQNVIIANNTFVSVPSNTGACGNTDIEVGPTTTATQVYNNILTTGLTYYESNGGTNAAISASDYNIFGTPAVSQQFWCASGNGILFATWKSGCSYDAHSQQTSPGISLTTYLISSTSAAPYQNGKQLSSLSNFPATLWETGAPQTFGTGYACGTGCLTRASSGAVDVGAYPYSSGGTYTITVSSITGNGTVTSSDSVINCTTGTTGTCSDSTATGTVTLSATPSPGYTLSAWGGACSGLTCSVTTTASVSATFSATSNATSYVNASTGNDTYDCSSATFTSGLSGPCLTPLRGAVNTAASGTINIAAGTYRLSTALNSTAGYITPKASQTFVGASCSPLVGPTPCTTIISGGIQFTSGQIQGPDGDGNYYVTGQTQAGTVTSYTCDSAWAGCNYPEDLFVNGVPYQHMNLASEATLAANTWWFNYSTQTIYLPSTLTPTFVGANTVETSVLETMFNPNGVNGVTLNQLTIEEFAAPLLEAGVDPVFGTTPTNLLGINWTVENSYLTLNHGAGIRQGFGMQMLNNVATANGGLGFTGGAPPGASIIPSGLVVKGNTVTLNNYSHSSPDFGAGGIKFGNTAYATIRSNTVQNNIGNGIHMDDNSVGALIDSNVVSGNVDSAATGGSGYGIICEISELGACTIRNNLITFVGIGGAIGLLSSTSSGVQAYCNVVTEPAGITGYVWNVTASNRGNNASQPNLGQQIVSTGNYFHHNTIIWNTGTGNAGFNQHDTTNQPNFFSNNTPPDFNTYHASSTSVTQFVYDNNNSGTNALKNFTAYQAAGADVHGTFDTVYTSGFPTTNITSPADQSTFSGTLTLNATASDSSGIASATSYVDWVQQTTISGAGPYSFSLPTILNGPHTVAVMATANSGVKTCNAVTLTQTLGPPTGLIALPGTRMWPGTLLIP